MNRRQGIFTIVLCTVSVFVFAWVLSFIPKIGNYWLALLLILISVGLIGLIGLCTIGALMFYDWLGK